LRLDPGELPEVRIGIRDIAALREPRHEPTGVDLIQRPPPAQEEAANILLNYEECRTLPAAMKSIPTLIYAEISTVCNLKCRMCGRAHYDIPASHQGLMSIETFRALSPLFTPGAMLGLFGRGESLMHPRFIEFLEIATRAGMKVGFNTNGLMLTTETARAMCELGQCHITFSVSAGTRETYRVIHGEDSWDRLWEKIGLLNEIKRQTGKARGLNELGMIKPVVYLEFVAQADNIRELPDLLRRAYDHEVSGLLVIDLTAHSEALESMRMNIPENQELARAVYQETLALHEELALRTNNKLELRLPHSYSNLAKKFITESESRILEEMRRAGEETSGEVDLCLEPWRTFYARFDGTVAPCVITGRILGDLKTTGALEIWNGEGFRRFRERMKTSSKPSECQRCHLCPGPKRYDVTLGDATTYEAL
jgi:MoaA/NifB/PqqE/SkfB family radical SAM enzyme